MAMWFAHLHFAELASRRLGELDATEVAWGALCCDVDKVSAVSRATSHYGHEGLDFDPAQFSDVAGLTREAALGARSFLAGYLSHLAVDEAWYRLMFELRDRVGVVGWDRESTKAWNLSLDRELRRRALFPPFVPPEHTVEAVLPHLAGVAGKVMRFAAPAYARWDGRLDVPAEDPLMLGFQATFAGLEEREAARVEPVLEVLDRGELDERVSGFVDDALRRFLDALERP